MKIKMFAIVAMVAAVLAVMFGGLKQAQAYNLVLVSSQALPVQTERFVQLGGGIHQSGPKKVAQEEVINEQKVEEIEPAAG